MRMAPLWPSDTTVAQPVQRVFLGGRERAHVSVQWEAECRGFRVNGPAVSARTGQIEWSPVSAVSNGFASDMPARGDRVEVWQGYMVPGTSTPVLVRTFTGKILSSVKTRDSLVSEIVDDFDMLSAPVDLRPLLPSMPPIVDGQAFRRIGLMPTYVTHRAAASAGFHATPPLQSGGVVSASMAGSTWPEHGTLLNSSRAYGVDGLPSFIATEWGVAVRDVVAEYEGATAGPGIVGISAMIGPLATTGPTSITMKFSDTDWIRLTVSASRAVTAQVSTAGTVHSFGVLPMSGATHVRFVWNTATSAWGFRDDQSGEITGTRSWPFSGRAYTVTVVALPTGPAVGGINAGTYSSNVPPFTPTARLGPSANHRHLKATRPLTGQSAVKVLRAQADAELASFWIDADGVLQWRNRRDMSSTTPVTALTSQKNLLDSGTVSSWDSVASRVDVTHKHVATSVRKMATITVWQGNGQSLDSGDTDSTIASPGPDDVWVYVDNSMDVLGLTGDLAGYNRGRRTWGTAVRVHEDGSEQWGYDYATLDFEVLAWDAYLFRTTVASSLGAAWTVQLRAPDTSKVTTGVWNTWSGEKGPILRAYGRAQGTDAIVAGNVVGPPRLPALDHDAGWYIQDQAGAQALANDLAAKYCAPRLEFPALPMIPDQRIELGDAVTIADPHVSGLTVTATVVRISSTQSEGAASMVIEVEPTTINISEKRTYQQLEESLSGSDYNAWQALLQGRTYSEVN